MKSSGIIKIVLLAFVGVSLIFVFLPESTPDNTATSDQTDTPDTSAQPAGAASTATKADEPATPTGHKMLVYYFHRTQRCKTCLTIEAYTQEVLKDVFPEALESGAVEWQAVNVEEPANEHFVEEYQLASSALVLVDAIDGEQRQWRNLDQIWTLVGDELKFKAYVEGAAMAMLEAQP